MSVPGLRRRFASMTTMASLIACSIATAAWISTGIGWGRYAALQGPHHSCIATVSNGYLVFQLAEVRPDPERPATARLRCFGGLPSLSYVPVGSIADASLWSRVALISTVERIPYSDGVLDEDPNVLAVSIPASCRSLVLPLWLLSLATAIAPVRWIKHCGRERVRRLRIQRGQCANCGYDLRASKEYCPECGASILPTATTAN
jgi:hypothetical protein